MLDSESILNLHHTYTRIDYTCKSKPYNFTTNYILHQRPNESESFGGKSNNNRLFFFQKESEVLQLYMSVNALI